MPEIISDTTPLTALLKIGCLDILREIYGQVSVPEAVFQEMEAGKKKPYYTDISKLDWINIRQIGDRGALSYFFDLDRGEAETIVLALECKAYLVIIDETLGRKLAIAANLKVTGTLG